MKPDPPTDEIREIRHQISAEFDHDPRKFIEYCRKMQERHKDLVISPGSEPAETEESANSPEVTTKSE